MSKNNSYKVTYKNVSIKKIFYIGSYFNQV